MYRVCMHLYHVWSSVVGLSVVAPPLLGRVGVVPLLLPAPWGTPQVVAQWAMSRVYSAMGIYPLVLCPAH